MRRPNTNKHNKYIQPVEAQADRISRRLRDLGVTPTDLGVPTIADLVDPEKPLSVNWLTIVALLKQR